MSTLLSIVVIEDDAMLRQEFERMVVSQPSLKWLGSAGSLSEARDLLTRVTPDVIVIDLGLPDGDGSELIAELAQKTPSVAALVTTLFCDEMHVIRAIEAGARGYLLKDSPSDEFLRAINLVHEGGAPLSPRIAQHLLARLGPAAHVTAAHTALAAPATPAPEPEVLTAREIVILTRIAQGFTVGETAEHLHISTHTAATHIKNIYSKMAVSNRMQAVNQARLRGLIK